MKNLIWKTLGVAIGLAVAMALIVAVEAFSSVVHPIPAELSDTFDGVCKHVANYPFWVLGAVVFAWSASTFASVWVSARIGSYPSGIIVCILLAFGIAFNLLKLPYPAWFKILMPICFTIACFAGMANAIQNHQNRRLPLPSE